MAFTNSTTNFHLPQFVADDKASWLTDISPAFETIDNAMQANKVAAQSAASTGNTAGATAVAALDKANANAADIESIKNALGTLNQFLTSISLNSVLTPINESRFTKNKTVQFTHIQGNFMKTYGSIWVASGPILSTIPIYNNNMYPITQIQGNPFNISVNTPITTGFATILTPVSNARISYNFLTNVTMMIYWDSTSNITYQGIVSTNLSNIWSESNEYLIQYFNSSFLMSRPPLPSNIYPHPVEINFTDVVKNINVDYAENVHVKTDEAP